MSFDENNVIRGRKLSLDQASLIGTGATCEVYLLPDDNVVKVLTSTDFEEAKREILLAKWAFKKGLNTAISYDVVDVDGHPGLLYESLGRDNLRNHLRDSGDQLMDLLKQYLEFVRSINRIEVEEGQLPSAKEKALRDLYSIRDRFTEDEFQRAAFLINTIPEDLHMVHGDSHMKNIKIVKNELFLIDLDTLSTGLPLFELSGLCCGYHAYNALNTESDEEGFNSFFGISEDIVQKTYEYIMDHYYEDLSEEEKRENRRKIELFTYFRMLHDLNPENEGEKALYNDMYQRVKDRLYIVDNLVLADGRNK